MYGYVQTVVAGQGFVTFGIVRSNKDEELKRAREAFQKTDIKGLDLTESEGRDDLKSITAKKRHMDKTTVPACETAMKRLLQPLISNHLKVSL